MDILEEKEAFLNVYMNYKGDSRKIQFNEETEQFMWRKNNVSDTEVEYVHLMNQRWYAWLACAKSKAQAVPEGFVLVPKEPTDEIIEAMNEFDYRNDYSDMDGAYRTIVETLEKAQEDAEREQKG
ncbi:hypothetical protein [Acinetobacter pseudolwoffii]|uniref:hypothetical protein n=1 Tax=Acinetobacter pseudolwoffii TaxID=2053287 RepID=UPI00094381CC|nr:hypothetical protein [Acinetobacter pseudolwoffii]